MSDGYVNSRVVKYDKNGRFVEVGRRRAATAPSQFNTPHSIASDAQGNVYVGDRGNAPRAGVRQQPEAARRSTTTSATRGRSASRRGRISTCSSRTRIPTATRPASWAITGEIYKMELDGTIIGKFGKAGKELGRVQHHPRDRLPQPERALSSSEITAWRAQKIMLKPTAADDRRQCAIGGGHEATAFVSASRRSSLSRRRRVCAQPRAGDSVRLRCRSR